MGIKMQKLQQNEEQNKPKKKRLGETIETDLGTFHETKFLLKTTGKIAIWILGMVIVGSFILQIVETMAHPKPVVATILGFLLTELIPLYILVVIFNHPKHKTFSKWEKVNSKLFEPVVKWSKIFWNDIKNHWKTVLILMVGMLVVQVLANFIIGNIATWLGFSNELVKSNNTAELMNYIKHNYLTLLATTVVAPFFEELSFRFVLTDVVQALFEKLHCSEKYAFSIAAIISAFIFATMHETSFNITQILTYMVIGLYFQWIRSKSNSIVAGALAHGGGNLIVALSLMLI
jgi:membrane protease YdiL (CAAX protease family)